MITPAKYIQFKLYIAIFILVGTPAAMGGLIPNGSFEETSTWSVVSSDSMLDLLSLTYSTEWSSAGNWSLRIERSAGATTGGSYIGVQQDLDLTGVTGFLFDVQDKGIDTDPIQFLIDGVVVGQFSNNGWPGGEGTDWGHTARTYDVSLPLTSTYLGVHTLTVRYYQMFSHWPADPKIYWIDNIRVVGRTGESDANVPEPATSVMFALGLFVALLTRRIRG